MINEQTIDRLLEEENLGSKANSANELFIKQFIANKRVVLFDKFVSIPINETESLLEIKRMLTLLGALELEVQAIIDSGKLANLTMEREK